MSKTITIYTILIVLVIGGLILARYLSHGTRVAETTQYDAFAQCLADSGAKFYGAFWCPHCKEQKEMFENSKELPYIECSTPDQQGQTKICIDENISGYPTWKFADGTTESGTLQLETLSEKTGCTLPI